MTGTGIAELATHRTERQRHVCAGIAIGHRIDVQIVDRLSVICEGATESLDGRAEARGVEGGGGHATDRNGPASPV
mgnify:CR=1 FL=1